MLAGGGVLWARTFGRGAIGYRRWGRTKPRCVDTSRSKKRKTNGDLVYHGELLRVAIRLDHDRSFDEDAVIGLEGLLQQDNLRAVNLARRLTELEFRHLVEFFHLRRKAETPQHQSRETMTDSFI